MRCAGNAGIHDGPCCTPAPPLHASTALLAPPHASQRQTSHHRPACAHPVPAPSLPSLHPVPPPRSLPLPPPSFPLLASAAVGVLWAVRGARVRCQGGAPRRGEGSQSSLQRFGEGKSKEGKEGASWAQRRKESRVLKGRGCHGIELHCQTQGRSDIDAEEKRQRLQQRAPRRHTGHRERRGARQQRVGGLH
jgi:hypothetical protein